MLWHVIVNNLDVLFALYAEKKSCSSGKHRNIIECKSAYFLGCKLLCDFMIVSDVLDVLHSNTYALTKLEKREYFTEIQNSFTVEYARYICRGEELSLT